MSYLVLARKYRPQRFEDVVGQEHVTRTLSNALKSGRVHHAFLFTGARGVGKTTAARILAKALSCDKAPTAEPCGECEACLEIASGASVDVQEIDAASNNGVDSIRDLREAIRYAPLRGKKKVYILDEVHMLSGGAWNALLKTLEEPPPHAVFVFATTDPHKLPATILSRVQRYDFKLVPTAVLVDHLATILTQEKFAFEPPALTLVAREAAGSVRDALSLMDQIVITIGANAGEVQWSEVRVAEILGVADRALLLQLASAVIDKNGSGALTIVDELFGRGYDLAHFAQTFLSYLRDLIVVRVAKGNDAQRLVDVSTAELDSLRALSERMVPGTAELYFDRFLRVVDDVGRSLFPRYVLEVGLLELVHSEGLEPLGAFLQRLETLEKRLSGTRPTGGPPNSASPTVTRDSAGGGGGGAAPHAATRAVLAQAVAAQAVAAQAVAAQAVAAQAVLAQAVAAQAVAAQAVAAQAVAQDHRPPAASGEPSGFSDWVQAVLAQDATLSLLAQARLLRHEGNLLRLGFEKPFAVEAMRERIAELTARFGEVTGQALRIEVEQVGTESTAFSAESLLDRETRNLENQRKRQMKEAAEHPARRWIDDRFGGTWKEPTIADGEG